VNYDGNQSFEVQGSAANFQDIVPSNAQPMVLNLLGDAQKANSYTFTQKEVYEYLKGVKLSSNLKKAIGSASKLLFVGFDFTHWYAQLLLYMLGINDRNKHEHPHIGTAATNEGLQFYLENEFSIVQINKDYSSFAQDFAAACLNYEDLNDNILGKDLHQFFVDKQLYKLDQLSAKLIDAKTKAETNAVAEALEDIEHKLDAYGQ